MVQGVDKNKLPLSFRDRMFNFYEFPMQLHFTCRDKQKGENIRARPYVPASRSVLAGVRSRKRERNTLAHSSAARAAAAERGRGARQGGTPGARGRAAAAGEPRCPHRGPFPAPRCEQPAKRRVREPGSAPSRGGGAGAPPPPAPPTSGDFLRGSGREGRRGAQPEPVASEAASPSRPEPISSEAASLGRPPQSRFTRK